MYFQTMNWLQKGKVLFFRYKEGDLLNYMKELLHAYYFFNSLKLI